MARDITKLHPFVRMLAEQLVKECKKQGLNIKITDCVRTVDEQDACMRAGTTTVSYPYTYHAWGLAFDVCQNDVNCAYPSDDAWWQKVGKIGKGLGLEWGGDWVRGIDRPHFQLNSYSGGTNKCAKLITSYGSPQDFFRNSDFKITTPKLPITPKSSRKKILWLQVRLNCAIKSGLMLDGIYGAKTIEAVKIFWRRQTGKNCTGKIVNKSCIDMLR